MEGQQEVVGTKGPLEQTTGQEAPQSVDPKVEKEVQAYTSGLMKMLHAKESSAQVLEMLKSAGPETSIPQAAIQLNDQMMGAFKQKGKEPSLEALLAGGVYLVGDLAEIGNAAGLWELEGEGDLGPILQNTLQQYIEKGVKDGSLDPVELQQMVEPLMSEEQRGIGMEMGQAGGVPESANEMTAMEQYGQKKYDKGMMKGGGA